MLAGSISHCRCLLCCSMLLVVMLSREGLLFSFPHSSKAYYFQFNILLLHFTFHLLQSQCCFGWWCRLVMLTTKPRRVEMSQAKYKKYERTHFTYNFLVIWKMSLVPFIRISFHFYSLFSGNHKITTHNNNEVTKDDENERKGKKI